LSGAVSIFTACSSIKRPVKTRNPFISLWLPFMSERTKGAFDHSLIYSHRFSSDCLPNCPQVDVWQYQYLVNNKIITSKEPIASKKQYWKNPHEARIIAISLFGDKDIYFNGLLQFLDSFSHIKEANNISDPVWGYETFTVRVYLPKRNPDYVASLGPIGGALSDDKIAMLLSRGVEIAYTDNRLPMAQKDATFWRFMVTAEKMPPGQKIRYLLRDADSLVIAVEVFAVADWMKSDKRYHRMHVIPICMGPLTASLWGGSHVGSSGDFNDFPELIKNYPYRFDYGDDELFSRDLIWPRLKASGSILTHYFARSAFYERLAKPYQNSCEEPTEPFCLALNPNATCEDRLLPNIKSFQGSIDSLANRVSLKDMIANNPEYFDLDLKNPERKFIYDIFKSQ
jgi:hypothetical protein